MASVGFTVDSKALSGIDMDFQKTLENMSSALTDANSVMQNAQDNMKSGNPASIIKAQIAMAQFTQVLTTLTQSLKALQDVTSAINRNISS
jgi:uncharacterized coiled-coil protein SlyX